MREKKAEASNMEDLQPAIVSRGRLNKTLRVSN